MKSDASLKIKYFPLYVMFNRVICVSNLEKCAQVEIILKYVYKNATFYIVALLYESAHFQSVLLHRTSHAADPHKKFVANLTNRLKVYKIV